MSTLGISLCAWPALVNQPDDRSAQASVAASVEVSPIAVQRVQSGRPAHGWRVAADEFARALEVCEERLDALGEPDASMADPRLYDYFKILKLLIFLKNRPGSIRSMQKE